MNHHNRFAQLLILANGLAAFGGGTVLRKGMEVIQVPDLPFLQGGSIFAFIVGTSIGFIFYTFFRKNATALKKIEAWFSILCAITSLILLFVFQQYAVNGKLVFLISGLTFFILLSFRFFLWYYARSTRVSLILEQNVPMSMVELTYYVGLISGLLVWNALDFFALLNIDIKTALMIDIVFQLFAGIIDLKAHKTIKNMLQETNKANDINSSSKKPCNLALCWILSIATTLLVIGLQSPIFVLTHYFSAAFNAYIISAFYSGAAIAAVFCQKTGLKLAWHKNTAKFYFNCLNKTFSLSMYFLCFLLGVISLGNIYMAYYSETHYIAMELSESLGLLFIASTILSGTIIELGIIGLVTQIGIEEEKLEHKKMVKTAYGMMVAGLAIGYFIMSFFSGFLSLSLIAVTCLFIAALITKTRQNTSMQGK